MMIVGIRGFLWFLFEGVFGVVIVIVRGWVVGLGGLGCLGLVW